MAAVKKATPTLRRPPASPPGAQVDQFITGSSSGGSGGQRGLVSRSGGKQARRFTIYLSPELGRALALHCAGAGVDISAAVSKAVEGYLAAGPPEGV